MIRRIFISILAPLLAGLVLFSAAPSALAQSGYPPRTNVHVNDFAEVLTAEDETTLRRTLQSLQDEQGIEGVVVTIRAVANYGTGDDSIESFATNLFNRWDIDDRETNDGFLILVAIQDREVRIELGRAYGQRYNDAMQQVIDEEMLPSFREGAYATGVLAGTEATITALTNPGSGGLWDRLRNNRFVQVVVVLLVLGAMMLRRIRYFFHIGCLPALWQLGTAVLGGMVLGGFVGALWGMADGDVKAIQETVMEMLTVLENGRFFQEFSLFNPAALTGAGIGAVVGVTLRFIGSDASGENGGGGSSGGGGASGSW